MICARCAREVATGAQRCPNCKGDPLLDGRYRLDQQLAVDSIGVSYRATRIDDATLVRARSRMLRRLPGEAERSARSTLLRQLEHPGLPRWLDELVIGEGLLATSWMIHEHLGGRSLAEVLAAEPERRLSEPRTRAWLRELADLLAYLHGQPEPVIHGGLAPALIQLRSSGHAGLLDLDSASAAIHGVSNRGLAERIAYAAPEQHFADPCPASDVWTLGAIATVSLSGSTITSLRDGDRTLRWRDRIDVSPELGELLAGMLDPDPTRRLSAAKLAERLAAPAQADVGGPRIKHPSTPPKPLPPRAPVIRRVRPSKSDVPIQRPDELSRELSQAQEVEAALAQQQRSQLIVARAMVVIVAALIAGLATYVLLRI